MAEEQKPKLTKQGLIEIHFKEKGSLSSKEANDLYGAMRLAAVVHKLKGFGWVFVEPAKTEEGHDKFGNPSSWVRYELVSAPDESAIRKKLKSKVETKKQPATIPSDIPPDKRPVLRPKQYKKHPEEKTLQFAGKQIIQLNLFDNGNQEI
jgi:hypothetical protein